MRLAAALPLLLAGCLVIDDDPDPPPGPEAPGAGALLGAGLSYGECLGYCWHQLTITDRELELRHASNDGDPDRTSYGRLTATGDANLGALEAALRERDLLETYGCPDCNDGGDAFLDLHAYDDIIVRTHWQADQPADEVADAHALLIEDLIRNLSRCEPSARLTIGDCEPI